MKNSRSLIKISLNPEDPPGNLELLLESIFWKELQMVDSAREFLYHVKEWGMSDSPYKVSDWEKYCHRSGLTQSKYHNMLKRLRRAGMIEKIYNKNRGEHEIHISRKFSFALDRMSRLWEEFFYD